MASLTQQIGAAAGQPSSVRIGVISSTGPAVVTVQGQDFNDVGFLEGYVPEFGDTVAVLGQSSAAGSDPASWLCLGKVVSQPAGPVMQAGAVLISFTTQTSFTTAVVFDTPFDSQPSVSVNINSGVGATANWQSRGFNVSTTGFTIFVFGPSSTWASVDVQWQAQIQTQ